MVDEDKDPSVEFINGVVREILEDEQTNSPRKRGINWNNVMFYGAISTGILLTGVGMAIDNWRNYNRGYEAGASSTITKIEVECYHHKIQSGETIDDAVFYFNLRTMGLSVTKEAVLTQNGLTEENLRTGEDITYCFKK